MRLIKVGIKKEYGKHGDVFIDLKHILLFNANQGPTFTIQYCSGADY